MQYFQYFQGLKNENKQMWFASNKEVRRRIEIEALILMTKLLFTGLISVTIIAFALIIARVKDASSINFDKFEHTIIELYDSEDNILNAFDKWLKEHNATTSIFFYILVRLEQIEYKTAVSKTTRNDKF